MIKQSSECSKASGVLLSEQAELAARANKQRERPIGPLKTRLSLIRNAPKEKATQELLTIPCSVNLLSSVSRSQLQYVCCFMRGGRVGQGQRQRVGQS